jgi:chemotaxis protein MotB
MDPELEFPPDVSITSKAWMVIFTDMVSLLLTFFVMLFAMSNVKVDKWSDMTDALSQSLNPSRETPSVMPSSEFNIGAIFRKQAINLDYLAGVIEESVASDPALAESKILRLEDRLVLALPGKFLFPSQQSTLSERARQALFDLGGVLRNIDNQISVNGHSYPAPPEGGEYASNWELSLARAIAVANALRSSGYTEDITAHGFADGKYTDLPELDEDQRSIYARRVDIIVRPTVRAE